ncbi:uncharacterized protein RCO7_02343 [Rhynchosporium graminicola]|uniref:Uncharacterized protein n=1 Tax=Rhynchosporium graminicola TaxID=2792576 RepID=A0A1E1JVW0_9HELO|nr:uncharacterized protein RCO7_02343 [Rhynchosporium commune]
MAPDLNSVPASSRASPHPSRRPSTSQQLSPPSTSTTTSSTSTSQAQSHIHPQGVSHINAQHTSPTPGPAIMSAALNILPSNQNTVNQGTMSTSPSMVNTGLLPGDNTGVGTGPGPLRHPRPLTAADLHLQLEKEQEAVVNRLTRELSLLRAAHNASVVSNTSSTSNTSGLPDQQDHNANHLLSGPSHPTPSTRHHRTSSATSSRSASALASLSSIPSTTADRTRGPSISLPSVPVQTGNTYPLSISLSRQNSTTSQTHGRSGTSSPLPYLSSNPGSYHNHTLGSETFPPYFSTSRPIPHRDVSSSSLAMTTGSGVGGAERGSLERQDSITSVNTTGRYEEAAFHRHELEAVKRENEGLKRRIRELELVVRRRRESDAGEQRVRSESVSTTASGRVTRDAGGVPLGAGAGIGGGLTAARGRERAKEDEDEEVGRRLGRESESEVQVGESARSAGL